MKIAGILVNYQTSELTMDAVDALLVELRPMAGFHVYVVDNDSGDGSLERLRQGAMDRGWQGAVTVLAAPRNGGYGYGINLAARQALASADRPDYLYVINTDAFADSGSIARMVQFMDSHPEVGITGSRVYGLDGVTQGAAFRFPSVFSEFEQAAAFGLVSRLLRRHIVAMVPPASDQEVDWLPGTSMLIRRQVFEGGVFFDEGFFLYFEEVDFAREVRQAGWRACYVADAPIKHIGSVSTGLAEQSRRLPDYWFDSRHRYFLKHHGRTYTAAADAAWVAGYLVFLLKRATLGRSDVLRRRMLRDFLRSTVRAFSGTGVPESAAPVPAADQQVPASQLALSRLLAEDFATCEFNPVDPGFWAVAVHRLGQRAGTIRSTPARVALQLAWHVPSTAIDWMWKVNLPASVEVGRRVRLHTGGGGMLLGARAIGNDVQIRHNTTFGPLRGDVASRNALPTIQDGVDIGSGVSILGEVTVGHGAAIAPNSLVLRDVPPQASVIGVPARVRPAGATGGATVPATVAGPSDVPTPDVVAASEIPPPQPGLLGLLAEDLRTYDFDVMEVGLWVTAVHRVRKWADHLPGPFLRTPVRAGATAVLEGADWFFGIGVPPEVNLGRRLRIWHHGSIRLAARSIGNDVHIRPNTTFGAPPGAPDQSPAHWPTIGDKADIGAGACILGNVQVGHDAFVGANSLVLEDAPAGSVVLGVPSRMLPRRK